MTDFESAMRAANPVPAPRPLDDAAIAVRAQAITGSVEPGRLGPSRWRQQLTRIGTVAAVIGACLLAMQWFTLWASSAQNQTWAEEILEDDAIQAVDPPTEPSQYWRIESHSTNYGEVPGFFGSAYISSSSRVTYVSVDGSRPLCIDFGEIQYVDTLGIPTVDFQPNQIRNYCLETAPNDREEADWVQPDAAFLAALPRDPEQLREVLGDYRSGAFVAAADLLRSGMVPADLRAAIFRALAAEPGVEVVAPKFTIDGREGIGISKKDEEALHGGKRFLIFDPDTGELIGEEYRIRGRTLGSSMTRTVVDDVPPEFLSTACVALDEGGLECPR